MKNNRAFTLVEILISASIFSIIILSIYSAFQVGVLSYRKIDSSFEMYQNARISLGRAEQDLKNSFAYMADDNKCGFSGDNKELEFFSVLDYYKNAALNAGIARIKYSWDQGSKTLTRTCLIGTDALSNSTNQQPDILASNVDKLKFEYAYQQDKNSASYVWQESWPTQNDPAAASEQEKIIPLAVRITMTLTKSGSSAEDAVEFIKLIPLGEATG